MTLNAIFNITVLKIISQVYSKFWYKTFKNENLYSYYKSQILDNENKYDLKICLKQMR